MFKKLIYTAFIGLAFASTSCTEDVMDRINHDEENPPAEFVPAKFMITDAITSTAFTTYGGAYAWYASSYTEQIFGTGNNQLMKAEVRQRTETASSTTFNNEWNSTYGNLNNIKQIIEKCSTGGIDDGKYDLRGMAQVLWVLDFEVLTDLHGDIPYFDALKVDVPQPKLDKQEDIYKDLLARADMAIDDLTKAMEAGMKNGARQDILFGGDLSQWIGLAHAAKARLLLNSSYRNPAALAQAVSEGEAALQAGFNGAALEIFDNDNNNNPWTAFFWSREYSGACKTVVDYMTERKDPRVDVYAVSAWTEEAADAYAPAGDADLAGTTEVVGFPAWLNNGAASAHIFSMAEIHFILAEAKARLGQDASDNFATAVKASFMDYASASGEDALADAADDYIASLGTPTLAEIMVQKYLSGTRDEQIVTYNDIRRCKAMGQEFIKLQNPNNTVGGANQWPLRMAYGNSDVISNPNIAKAFGSGNEAGNYLFTEPVWLFGGSR